MSTLTDNYKLTLPEGTDYVNPLTQYNPNFETIDAIMKANADASVGVATELKANTVHAITRTNQDANVILFTATSNFTAGETFTVDGTQVTALTPSGETLTTNSYIIGSSVLCVLKNTLLTFYLTPVVSESEDSKKLGGQLPAYYATASDLESTNAIAVAAGASASQNATDIATINSNLTNIESEISALQSNTPLLDFDNAVRLYSANQTSGTISYTATSNGVLFVSVTGGSTAGVYLYVNGSQMCRVSYGNTIALPISNGDVVTSSALSSTATVAYVDTKFVPYKSPQS